MMRSEETLRVHAAPRKQCHEPVMDGLGGFAGELLVHDGFDQRCKRTRESLNLQPAGSDAPDEHGELGVGRGEVPLGGLQVEWMSHGDG